MSSLIVEVSRIEQIAPHPNADKLELAQIKGWQCVVPRAKYRAGDLVSESACVAPRGATHADSGIDQPGRSSGSEPEG